MSNNHIIVGGVSSHHILFCKSMLSILFSLALKDNECDILNLIFSRAPTYGEAGPVGIRTPGPRLSLPKQNEDQGLALFLTCKAGALPG